MVKKVMIGMSGGVDSSVSAALLKKQGYEVYGVTMVVFDTKNTKQMLEDAKAVCRVLSIPHRIVDFKQKFKDTVVRNFIKEYQNGKTPNPCVLCNRLIKFGLLYEVAKDAQMDYIATGHYADIEYQQETGQYLLKKSKEDHKDQTYFLYTLTQEKLKHILFPLSGYQKEEVRSYAKELGLPVFDKKDSQEICFIDDNDYIRFLKQYGNVIDQDGTFIEKDGTVIGRHKGIWNFTIGQRKGLGMSFSEPKYVVDLNAQNNTVTLGTNEELFQSELIFGDANFIAFDSLNQPMQVEAKVRYAAKPANALLTPFDGNLFHLRFDEKQRAITKGQSVVLYQGDTIIGGGIIQ